MPDDDDALAMFGLVLNAVREMVEEQGLSKAKALRRLRTMTLPAARQLPAVQHALDRLRRVPEGTDFELALAQESLRALGLKEESDVKSMKQRAKRGAGG